MASDKRSLGRQNQPVLAKISDADRKKLWETIVADEKELKRVSNDNEALPFSPCVVWQGSLQNGYPSISQGHAKSKLKVHMLAAWVQHKRLPETSEVCSHLCHRKACINPEHLVIESISANNARKGCLAFLEDADSSNIWCLCPHLPTCKRSDSDNNGGFAPFVVIPDPIEDE